MTEVLPVTDISLPEIEAAGSGQRRLRRPAAARGARSGSARWTRLGRADGDADRRAGGDRGDLCRGRARQAALRPAVGDRSRPAPATRAGTAPATSATSTREGRLWVEGRLVHVITSAGRAGHPGRRRAGRRGADRRSPRPPWSGSVPTGTQHVVAVVVPPAEVDAGSAGRRRRWPRRSGDAAPVPLAAVLTVAPAADRHPAQLQDRPRRRGPVGRPGAGRPATGPAVRVLVTGASGALGAATARALAARGDRVTVLQRRPAGLGLPEVLADVADAAAVRRAVAGQDAVVHLAAKVDVHRPVAGVRRGPTSPGTAAVVAACRAAGVGRLVHVSSPSVAHAGSSLVGVGAGPGRSGPGPGGVRAEQGRRRADRAGGRRRRTWRSRRSGRTWSGGRATPSWSAGWSTGPGPAGWCWSGPARR